MRKMWLFYQRLFQQDADKIEKTKEMQQYFDQIFSKFDLENKSLVAQPAVSDFARQSSFSGVKTKDVNKKLERIQKELDNIKKQPSGYAPPLSQAAAQTLKNQRTQQQITNTIQVAQQMTINDKPMSLEEKNVLKNHIGQLTTDQ